MNNEQRIWSYFKNKGFNDFGVAGLMGNLHAESALNPLNLQNSFERKLGYTDVEYVEAVDSGEYDNFVHDSAGFGIAQWTFWSRKEGLIKFARSQRKSIGDLGMQLDYLYKEMVGGYRDLVLLLRNATNIREASDAVLLQFERPADQSESMQLRRASYGEEYYKRYAEISAQPEDSVDQEKVFGDSIPDDWAADAVAWATENQILFGDEHGDYQLHKECTRQEMLVFMHRLYQLFE